FEGGFVVDNVDNYELAFNLGTNPKESLVKLKVSRLESDQVINLVNAVADTDIDKPKRQLIRFQDVNIYASPLGCIIGTQHYPAGFVVQGKAFILDKKVEIDCRLGRDGLKLKGEIDGFCLGPLTVKGGRRIDGTQAENALIDLEITKQRQHFEISGSIALWDLEANIFVLAEVLPNPQLEFNFELGWSNLLRFQVDGKLIRPHDEEHKGELTNLDDADFQLHAVMEQRILTEISNAMRDWFKSAQVSVHEGIEEAKRKVDEAKLEFERKCEEAKKVVQETREKFEQKMEEAQSGLREQEKQCEQERADNERWILEQHREADDRIREANAVLDAKKKDFEDDLEDKKRDLGEKKRQGEEAIGGAIRDLQDKRISVQRDFGNAIQALESAQSRVNDEQCKFWS
ncbi:hypothetical protein BX600DRAFT_371661, partial [Xylariales sp. PMI_506]